MKPSALGLGCVTFGREIDAASSFSVMDAAMERGITLFDTAAAYANGASEAIVGQWLAARPKFHPSPVIATKMLPPYTAVRIDVSVDQSLRRLGLPSIPLLFLHRWDESILDPRSLLALDRLVRTGKVGAVGASNFSSRQLASLLEHQEKNGATPIRAVQNNQNFAVRDVDQSVRLICAENGIEIITYSPLGAGFLSGKHQSGVQPGSRFDIIPGHQHVYFNPESLARLAFLQDLAGRLGEPVTKLALIWAFNQTQTSLVLIGARKIAHLDQAFEAAAASPDLVAEVMRQSA